MYMYRVFPTRVYVFSFSLPQVRLMFLRKIRPHLDLLIVFGY